MPCTKKVDKNCEDCGTLLVQVSPTRMFCYDCAKKRQKAVKKHYNTVKRKEKIVLQGSPIPNPNAKYCKGCKYWYGSYEGYAMCNYIFCVGHRRPCPPGKDCTEKVAGKRKRSREFDIEVG
jgi:hypothetical protein